MAKNLLSSASFLIPGVRQWRAAYSLLSGNSGSDLSDFRSSLNDILEALSDHYLGTHYGQSDLQENQQVFNAAQAQLNRDWQQMMVDSQNQYNSPSAMMQRFRDAGLNPSLMFSGSAPAIESASPSGGGAAVSGLGSSSNSADLLLSSRSRLMNAQASKAEVEADSISAKLPDELRQIQEQNKVLSAQVSELNKKIELYSAQIGNLNLDGQLKVAQAAKNYFDINLASATFERDSNKVLAEINYLRSLSDEADSRTQLNKRNLYELRESWSYRLLGFDLENSKVASEIGLNRAKVVESNFVAQQIGLDIQAGRLHASINQGLYDTSFGGKGSKLERKINQALLTITDYFGKSAVSIGNGLQSAGALKMLLK